jgi:DNA-directed RNA polymerase specialized sigma subunit
MVKKPQANKLYLQIQKLVEEYLKAQSKETKNTIFKEILSAMEPIEVNALRLQSSRFYEDLRQDYYTRVYYCLNNYDPAKKVLFVTYVFNRLQEYITKLRQEYEAGGVASAMSIWWKSLNVQMQPYDNDIANAFEIRNPQIDIAEYTVNALQAKDTLDKLKGDPLIDLLIARVGDGVSLLQASKSLGIDYQGIKHKLRIAKKKYN